MNATTATGAQKLLSIIVPCHNVETKILPLISCLSSADTEAIEVVFINDCSEDATVQVLKAARERLAVTARIVETRCSNPCGARNAGLAVASGKYVWFVDADDTIMLTPVLNTLSKLHIEAKDIYAFKVREYSDPPVTWAEFGSGSKFLRWMQFGRICGKLIRREFLCDNSIRYPDGVLAGGDNVFTLLVALHVQTWEICNEFIYEVVPASGSITRSGFDARYLTRWMAIEQISYIVAELVPAVEHPLFKQRLVLLGLNYTWSYYLIRRRRAALAVAFPRLLSSTRTLGLLPYIHVFLRSGSMKNRIAKHLMYFVSLPFSWRKASVKQTLRLPEP